MSPEDLTNKTQSHSTGNRQAEQGGSRSSVWSRDHQDQQAQGASRDASQPSGAGLVVGTNAK